MDALPKQWAAEHGHFRYVPVISEAKPEDAWTGRTGFVHKAVMEDFRDLSGHQVYACGVPIMVDSARKDFIEQSGLPADEFHADSFSTAADRAAG
jgi:CDP-4-dehydro-6-deoxyglucose reductase, E3